MSTTAARLCVLALLILFVAALFRAESYRSSPGALAGYHNKIAELAGADGCARCHRQDGSGSLAGCLDCHSSIGSQIAERRGFHGTLSKADPNGCGHCHVEHVGSTQAMAGLLAFPRAGVADRTKYQHDALAFTLEGTHRKLGCEKCHTHAHAEELTKNQSRFTGLTQACESCHQDPHRGRMAKGCTECHQQSGPFASMEQFHHGGAFPLLGAHAKPECGACHVPGSAHAVEEVAGKSPPSDRSCGVCHSSPHAEHFLSGAAAQSATSPEASCAQCHQADHSRFSAALAEPTRRLHGAGGFPLEPPHGALACERCHPASDEKPQFSERYPGRSAAACEQCHGDPHGGTFQKGALAGACLDCHTSDRFAPATFAAPEHSRTRFPLTGAHTSLECARCHAPAESKGQPPDFQAAESACIACHRDPHHSAWQLPAAEQSCESCHTTMTFSQVDHSQFDHGRATGFALLGAHQSAGCSACHRPLPERDSDGRLFGRAELTFPRAAATAPEACIRCHSNPHAFASAKSESCGQCHTADTFRGEHAQSRFDHAANTPFRLDGAHARAQCIACHTSAPAGQSPLAVRPPQGAACASCHADPHLGQFADGGSTNCARCHSSTESFRSLSFDHQRDSRFALDATHAALRCQQCHVSWEANSGTQAIRYRPLGTQCVDCHEPPKHK
ncbi:MAG: hypothetical protein JNJ88_21265 [Planctomycetes bacterium]|nr:hypothetical protein [Planctomycetota bacterium]